MRPTIMIVIAALLTPALCAPAFAAAPATADISAKKKVKKKPTKVKDEYLKAAPGTGPSGPK